MAHSKANFISLIRKKRSFEIEASFKIKAVFKSLIKTLAFCDYLSNFQKVSFFGGRYIT
jgi:hypothetical protein